MNEYIILEKYPTFLEKLNSNPDKYAQKLSLKELISIVDTASDLYYNGDENGSGITDYAYDALYYYLRKKQKDKTVSIGYDIGESRKKVKLPGIVSRMP